MLSLYVLPLIIGMQVTWTDRTTAQVMCGKLATIDEYERAWIIPNTNPQFYAIEPTSNVTPGCAK